MANRLKEEQSLYLQQHANNPVDWYPWGEEAFEKAKSENKPVLISIGYAACHWCHVMEHESFENEEVAAYMNEHFVSIKVDREEHPGVDHMYMDAVQALTGSGGWPLNVFARPDKLPFYGGTYFPPKSMYGRISWMELLHKIHDIWHKQKDEVNTQSDQMLNYLKQVSQVALSDASEKIGLEECNAMSAQILSNADKKDGGFGRAPKFLGTMAIGYLLEHYHFTQDNEALQQALLSLNKMLDGGIYDQLAGGISRYATDDQWLVPHFEKMLYDNALLVSVLADAYALTKDEKYSAVMRHIIAFVEYELKDPVSGGYYCALDADSEGVEGKYYTWTWEEWSEVIGDNPIVSEYFGVRKEGNWEHTNILHVATSISDLARKYEKTEIEIQQEINAAKHKLLLVRKKRIRPHTDDKSLLSWNALMNNALSKAAFVLDDEELVIRAEEHMSWMLNCYENEGVWQHVWKNGVAKIHANLDDYAYLIQALIQLASTSGNTSYIDRATAIAKLVQQDFIHEDKTFYYYTSIKQKDIPVRKVDLYDGATPSANAVMIESLLWLGLITENYNWYEQATHALSRVSKTVLRYTYSFAYWSMLIQRKWKGLKLTVLAGEEIENLNKEFKNSFLPQTLLVAQTKEENNNISILKNKFYKTHNYIYVCNEDSCNAPVETVKEALVLIDRRL